MKQHIATIRCAFVLCAFVAFCGESRSAEPAFEFRLSYEPSAYAGPFTGRVYVMLLRDNPRPLPKQLNWFNPEPTFAQDVTNWQAGQPLVIGAEALSHPTPLHQVKPGTYYVQAVMDRDLGGISFAASEGNIYSQAVRLDIDPAKAGPIELTLDRVYRAPDFPETDTVKLVDIESSLLTKFHGRPMRQRAAVILPPSFAAEPERRYPVVYEITGFGGDHTFAPRIAARKPWDVDGEEMIWVVLDGNCRLGHHVFADSANNGPVGTALVTELIPHIEAKYRGIGTPEARFVTGHSSGGWSSLWLQVTYPEFFGGCWSTSPDPVDFRDFQRVNIYEPGANLFFAADGTPRPLARRNGSPVMYFQPFSNMEVVMGRGGQLFSFEAVFSPRGSDGTPKPLWDRTSGAINPAVAKAWEKYDIRKTLEDNWQTLAPKLSGKIHVYMGEEDTFYLEGATRLLKAALERLNAEAVVELFPGKSHALVDSTLRKRMNQEMAAAYRKTKVHNNTADIFVANQALGRGINFGNALEAPREGEWGMRIEAEYFRIIKEAGFDSVRVPVKWSAHAQEQAPYTINAKFFERIDWVLDQAAQNKLNVVLNVHHYDELTANPDRHLPRLVGLWQQIATRYKDRPASVYFELLNEPHDKLTESKWNEAIPQVLKAVRATNPTRPVIIGPGQWNAIRALPKLELPDDPNLILTVHYYDPFEFTHQGASWAQGSEKWLGRKWTGSEAEVAAIRRAFDVAAAWAKQRNRPVFLGEFGAYERADMESRERWTRTVAREAQARGWSWAYWEFGAGFGAYDRQKQQWRDPLKKALLGK
jgi:aryl-phospho-beta-D-glucosidase BglC (GH1 family)/S-formylglutathione hydrolase FrmB